MASTKISQLAASAALVGTEIVPIVQDNVTVKTTVQDIANLAGGGANELNITGNGTVYSPSNSIGYIQIPFLSTMGGGAEVSLPYSVKTYSGVTNYGFSGMSGSGTATSMVIDSEEAASYNMSSNNTITSLVINNLKTFGTYSPFSFGSPGSSMNVLNCSSLTTLSFPDVTSIGGIPNGYSYNFSGNALSQASVDDIFHLFYLYAPTVTNSPVLDVSGGTNAIPSATALTEIAAIQSRGWTVYYAALP